jgi:hypothetical protein
MGGIAVRVFLTLLLIALPLIWWWQIPEYVGREMPGVWTRYVFVGAVAYILTRRWWYQRDLIFFLFILLAFAFETFVVMRHGLGAKEFNTGQMLATIFGAAIGRIWSRYPEA